MSQVTFSPHLFSNAVLRKFDQITTFQDYANTAYTGEIKRFGDSIHVQTAPTISFSASSVTSPGASTFATGTGPGGVISATDWTMVGENLVINKYHEYRTKFSTFELTQSGVDLESVAADRYAVAYANLMDDQFRDQILSVDTATIPTNNKLYSGAPKSDVSKTTIYGYIEEMRTALANLNVVDNLVLFLCPKHYSALLQSGVFDGTDKGFDARKVGSFGMLGNVKVIMTPQLTASFEMIMLQDKTVNFVTQINETAMEKAPDGFYYNFMATAVWGGKIFTEMAKGVCIFYASA